MTAIAPHPAMPTDDLVRLGISDLLADAQIPGKEVEGPEVFT